MAFIGWLFCLLVSVAVLFLPFLIVAISAIGGGLKRMEDVICVLIFILGVFLLWMCVKYAPFAVVAA